MHHVIISAIFLSNCAYASPMLGMYGLAFLKFLLYLYLRFVDIVITRSLSFLYIRLSSR